LALLHQPSVDAVVVGGGVAGSLSAIVLRGLGLSVVLVERQVRFRDKVRGEGIHPWGIDEAEDFGLRDVLMRAGAHPLPDWITYHDRQAVSSFNWADDSARGNVEHGVPHPLLQQRLIEECADRGVVVLRPASLTRLNQVDDRALLEISTETGDIVVNARIVVGADGGHSRVRSQVGVEQRSAPLHHWFVGVLIEGLALDSGASHAGLLPGGRFFILPQSPTTARLYAGLMPDRIDVIQRDPSGASLLRLVSGYLPDGALDSAKVIGPQGIFSNADTWVERGATGNVVLVGDAAGANDPSIGHGISLALRDARELRDLLAQEGLTEMALEWFAARRSGYLGVLREYANWMGELWIEEGEDADIRRARFLAARELDPEIAGFGSMTSRGPRDLVATNEIRSRFFGETASLP
jgi:2-polyprenyl-6-methoxyphenol hydroxylase-like FAD-dependent oxidoreductase